MAVSIDTVYQRVLVLANKEQRGYITPQEFNLLANHAQMEIFGQYFYDLNQWKNKPNIVEGNSDIVELINEKLEIFDEFRTLSSTTFALGIPGYELSSLEDLYRINMVSYNPPLQEGLNSNLIYPPSVAFELVSEKEFYMALHSPLTKPTPLRPIYAKNNGFFGSAPGQLNAVFISDGREIGQIPDVILVNWTRKPKQVEWAYVVVNDKPLYNDNISVDFELHVSEEIELVYKILKLAGVNLKAQEVVQVGQTLEQTQIQQEKQ